MQGMQQGHNFIFLKIYIDRGFTSSDPVKKLTLMNNVINSQYLK